MSMTMVFGSTRLRSRASPATSSRRPCLLSELRSELVGNVSLRILPTESPDALGRSKDAAELRLAVLVEQSHREVFELTVGKPQVVAREIDGEVRRAHVERVSASTRRRMRLGVLAQLFALRKGRAGALVDPRLGLDQDGRDGPGRRRLIGFRTEFLLDTRGAGILAAAARARWDPFFGELRRRDIRARSSRTGAGGRAAFPIAILNLEERGSLFVAPGAAIYEGMWVGGEHPRRGLRRERDQGEEADEHARRVRRCRRSGTSPLVRSPATLALEYIREDK